MSWEALISSLVYLQRWSGVRRHSGRQHSAAARLRSRWPMPAKLRLQRIRGTCTWNTPSLNRSAYPAHTSSYQPQSPPWGSGLTAVVKGHATIHFSLTCGHGDAEHMKAVDECHCLATVSLIVSCIKRGMQPERTITSTSCIGSLGLCTWAFML